MSQQRSLPFTPRPSILRSPSPRVFVTPPPEEISEYVQYQAEFIDIIPARNRSVWRLTYGNGELVHFRPTPNASMDPFAHAIFTQRSEGEKCSIEDCEYCSLCAKYFIDPHALQTSLISEGYGSLKWDPYFHWMMNEQIPRLHSNGSLNTGKCWIKTCQYPYCISHYRTSIPTANPELLCCPCKELKDQAKKIRRKYFFACGCGNRRETNGNDDIYYMRITGSFAAWPVETCPNWSKRKWLQFSPEICCSKCSVMAQIITKGLAKPTALTCQKKQHNDIIYRRIAFALSPLAVDPEAKPREKWEDYEHVFFNLSLEAIRPYKNITFADTGELSRESRFKKWFHARAPSPHPTVRLAPKRSRRRNPSLDGYESDAESMSWEPSNRHSKKKKLLRLRRVSRLNNHAARVSRLELVRVKYRSKSVWHKLLQRQSKRGEIFTSGANTSLGRSLVPEGSIISTPTGSALAALRSTRHAVSADNITFTVHQMTLISPLEPKKLSQVNVTVGEARPNSDEDGQERFTQWLSQIESGWNESSSRTVKLEPISFWRKIKILSGWEEDPNVCRYCSWCKTACMCQIQQEDGSWVMCRDLGEVA